MGMRYLVLAILLGVGGCSSPPHSAMTLMSPMALTSTDPGDGNLSVIDSLDIGGESWDYETVSGLEISFGLWDGVDGDFEASKSLHPGGVNFMLIRRDSSAAPIKSEHHALSGIVSRQNHAASFDVTLDDGERVIGSIVSRL
jgi:hypothetical protein